MKKTTDERPDPKPRKQPQLWQSYLWWDELVELRKRHNLRAQTCEAGKSNLDAQTERDIIEAMSLDRLIVSAKKQMTNYGGQVGPVWDWLTGIRGLGEGGLAAQLVAQIDDIGKFDTVSKLWRFCGQAVIDGQAERNSKGEKAHYNARLKSVCWQVVDQFIKQQTPGYVDIYYEDKARLRRLHPEPEKTNGNSAWPTNYTDSHVHRMAMRKTAKIFLQHLWVIWREAEGLPVTAPYIHDVGGHTHIITPEMCAPADIRS